VIAKMRGTFDEEQKATREQRKFGEISNFIYLNNIIIIEIREIKHKKKLIDKFLKLREATEDILTSKKKGLPGQAA
jgi:SepF-like predicted cell division protein (DUF552 family)